MCKFVLPIVCLCGSVVDAKDNPPKVYTLCGVCAMWLGFGAFRFPQGLRFNLSEEERERIRALNNERDIADKEIKEVERTSREKLLAGDAEGGLGVVHDFWSGHQILENSPDCVSLYYLEIFLTFRVGSLGVSLLIPPRLRKRISTKIIINSNQTKHASYKKLQSPEKSGIILI